MHRSHDLFDSPIIEAIGLLLRKHHALYKLPALEFETLLRLSAIPKGKSGRKQSASDSIYVSNVDLWSKQESGKPNIIKGNSQIVVRFNSCE